MNKTPTLREKVKMYEDLLHKINLMQVACDNEGIQELLHNIDKWSYMFRCNGEGLTDKKRQELIDRVFWNLCNTPETDKLTAKRQFRYSKLNN